MGNKIVILGAGFAGLQIARHLKQPFEVTIIDQYNFHQFQPLFYQVATARLEPSAISFPLRKIFQRKSNVKVRVAKVLHVDTVIKTVYTTEGSFSYDKLIIATGCTSNYFGNENIAKHAFPMKSTNEAIALRNRILLNFEDALSASGRELEEIMNIVIVGGGPTGVELAGALAEMKKNILPKDYPDMNFEQLKIYLIEASGNTLQNMSKEAQQASQQYLRELGVEVYTNTAVADYDGHTVIINDGRTIPSRTLIWGAGVKGNVPEGIPQHTVVRGNRIKTNRYNEVETLDSVYAIGDIAYMETEKYPKGHPQVANVAINQAKNLAENFKRMSRGTNLTAFEYKDPGSMATVGKRKAVVDLPFIKFKGVLAWFTWMFLHLMLILSVKNKLFIFINWAISYMTNDTTLRLILLPTHKQVELTNTDKKELMA